MPILGNHFDLARCPHCYIDSPSLPQVHSLETTTSEQSLRRYWRLYKCTRCGGLITAASIYAFGQEATEWYPKTSEIDAALPDRARAYLQQAVNSRHAASGAVMLAASAVDAMLKAKGYKEGSLYSRIDKAAADHLITKEMAQWAHQVRLDANEQRHSDEATPLPTSDDASRIITFTLALGQFLFVLPAQVAAGLQQTTKPAN